MRPITGAAVAACIFAIAAPSFAQTTPAAPAAPAAPPPAAAAYVSPCGHPAVEPYPTIPDPITGKVSEVSRAQVAYKAWLKPIDAFTECKRVELEGLNKQLEVAQAGTPWAQKAAEYNSVLEPFNKGVEAYKASKVPLPPQAVKPVVPGKACGATPTVPPAPPLIDGATAKPGDIKKAQSAFAKWRDPLFVYLQCKEAEVRAIEAQAGPTVFPLQNKYKAALADYEGVNKPAKEFVSKWNEFATAYNKRLAAAAHD